MSARNISSIRDYPFDLSEDIDQKLRDALSQLVHAPDEESSDMVHGNFWRAQEVVILGWMANGLEKAVQLKKGINPEALEAAYHYACVRTEIDPIHKMSDAQGSAGTLLGTAKNVLPWQRKNRQILAEFVQEPNLLKKVSKYFGLRKKARMSKQRMHGLLAIAGMA